MRDRLAQTGAWIARGRGRRRITAFGAGALSILSMAPFFVWPILWLTLPLLLWLVGAAERSEPLSARVAPWQRSAIGRAGDIGWWFGFGYHVFGLFWIGEAFLVEAEIFAWLLPIAVFGLPAGLALFTAAASAGIAALAPVQTPDVSDGARAPQDVAGSALVSAPTGAPVGEGCQPIGGVDLAWSRCIAMAVCFGLAEWLRGHVLTGLPWNVLGYALTGSDVLLASAGTFGIYGLTILAVLVFTLPFAVLGRGGPAVLPMVLPLVPPMGLLGGLALLGSLTWVPDLAGTRPLVRIVQPSVPQRDKWRPENQRRIFDDHMALSIAPSDGAEHAGAAGGPRPALIVWPEAAMPFLPLAEPVALAEIGRMLPDGVTLASGALRAEPPRAAGERRRVFNSLILFGRGDDSATVFGTYDKTHLVPFGEYLPLQALLETIGLQQLSRLRGGFTAGPEPRPLLDIKGVGALAPLICYEAIFPGRVVQSSTRPRALLNITNDGWFGNTTGPRQHLHMARVRAVEEGLPVIRAANNGISAMIDARGTVVARLDLNRRGTLDSVLPPATRPTFYARFGEALFWCMLMALLGLSLHLRRA